MCRGDGGRGRPPEEWERPGDCWLTWSEAAKTEGKSVVPEDESPRPRDHDNGITVAHFVQSFAGWVPPEPASADEAGGL